MVLLNAGAIGESALDYRPAWIFLAHCRCFMWWSCAGLCFDTRLRRMSRIVFRGNHYLRCLLKPYEKRFATLNCYQLLSLYLPLILLKLMVERIYVIRVQPWTGQTLLFL
ncbi:hypothetical protein TRVA0_001S09230 [Trichomonascus vanleenenianus]|uniref:uncharacterized protein n=1 Tax=Trichomonascus vanleenenianus TaxID=2268995 RepID=UPI003ECA0045